jgi:hypothetical protein
MARIVNVPYWVVFQRPVWYAQVMQIVGEREWRSDRPAMLLRSGPTPALPDEAFARESFYQDCDWFQL